MAEAVERGLQTLVLGYAESAAERAAASWGSPTRPGPARRRPADLDRASHDFRSRAERIVRDWQAGVLDMVRIEGADKRMTARFLAFGVNGLSVALMVVVFAHTAGSPGGGGIAGGRAVLGQKLLEAVFGDQAVRSARRAGPRDLDSRVAGADGRRAARYPRSSTGSGSTRRHPTRCVTPPAGWTTQRFASQSRVKHGDHAE